MSLSVDDKTNWQLHFSSPTSSSNLNKHFRLFGLQLHFTLSHSLTHSVCFCPFRRFFLLFRFAGEKNFRSTWNVSFRGWLKRKFAFLLRPVVVIQWILASLSCNVNTILQLISQPFTFRAFSFYTYEIDIHSLLFLWLGTREMTFTFISWSISLLFVVICVDNSSVHTFVLKFGEEILKWWGDARLLRHK